jgi:F1F0 ATPase subunit 2
MEVSLWQLGFASISGMVLGLFYFGGLWFTVKRLPFATRPAILTLCSYLARLGVTLPGFYLLMDGSWQRLLAVMFGFMVMRIVLVRLWKPVGIELPLPGQ